LSREPDGYIIDAPHREWVPGIDYVILGRQQVVHHTCPNDDNVPKCLSFLIKHLKTGRKLHLKVRVTGNITLLTYRYVIVTKVALSQL